MGYSEQQQAVIDSTAKRLAVLAGAGSGKSHTMVGKVKNYIDNGVPARNIAVITFTNEATDSLIERLEKLNCDVDGLTTKTLHSFCYNIIKIIYNFSNRNIMPKIIMSPDAFTGHFWKLVGVYDDKDKRLMPHKSWRQYASEINDYQLARHTPDALIKETYSETPDQFRKRFLKKEYQDRYAWSLLWFLEYEAWKVSTRQVDFNDLLLVALRELAKAPKKTIDFIKNKYKVIIIDEMQDTNALVVDILKLMTNEDTTIIMVGDIRQSIYSFMNASPKVIMGYTEYDKFERLSLNANYRSSTEIVDNGNYFCSHYPSFNIGGDTVPTKPANGFPVTSFISEDEMLEVRAVSEQVYELLKEGYKHKDICIMFRTNAQAVMVLNWCIEADLPFSIKKDSASIFDRSEMKDVLAYLKIFNEPNKCKLSDFKRILNKPTRYLPNKSLESVSNKGPEEVGYGADLFSAYIRDQKLADFVAAMKLHGKLNKGKPFCEQISYIMNDLGYGLWWENSDDKDRFFDLTTYTNALGKVADKCTTYKELIDHINDIRRAIKEKNTEDGITFTTIHSSKGLEWPVCIVLGVCDRLYPFYRALEENGKDGFEEEARLFYVASTRPIDRLYYSEVIGSFGKNKTMVSPFAVQTNREVIGDSYGQEETVNRIKFGHYISQTSNEETKNN